MGSLWRSCARVRERSELWFGVVRWIGRGIGVLDGGPHRARGEGEICRGCSRFLLLNFLLGRRWRNDFGLFVKI